jgi:hypothetical protein
MFFLYINFLYQNELKSTRPILFSYMSSMDGQLYSIELLEEGTAHKVSEVLNSHRDHCIVTFDATANINCLEHLGVEAKESRFISLKTEAQMITLTHQNYRNTTPEFSSILEKCNVTSHITASYHTEIQSLINKRKIHESALSPRVNNFNRSYISCLPNLIENIWQFHLDKKTGYTIDAMTYKGEYIKASVKRNFHSEGFPIDKNLHECLFSNKHLIVHSLQVKLNDKYGPLYKCNPSKGILCWDHGYFSQFVEANNFLWDLTSSGNYYVLDQKYLKEKSTQYGELQDLYQIRKSIKSLNGKGLMNLPRSSNIKPSIHLYSQKSGRNSPKPSEGFILTDSPLIRSLIKPRDNQLFIEFDWEQQEIAIGAALSGDKKYLELYDNTDNDVYLTLAKMARAIPSDGNREMYESERQTFKTIQLGLSYGKGAQSLAYDLYASSRDEFGSYKLDLTEAEIKADEIYNWHKQTFSVYWAWIDQNIKNARKNGYIKSKDDWFYFVGHEVRDTQLINFPMQANGAAILRKAVILVNELNDIDLVGTLHDSLLVNCDLESQERTIASVKSCMDNAVDYILGSSIHLRIDVKVHDSKLGYSSDKTNKVKRVITDLFANNEV